MPQSRCFQVKIFSDFVKKKYTKDPKEIKKPSKPQVPANKYAGDLKNQLEKGLARYSDPKKSNSDAPSSPAVDQAALTAPTDAWEQYDHLLDDDEPEIMLSKKHGQDAEPSGIPPAKKPKPDDETLSGRSQLTPNCAWNMATRTYYCVVRVPSSGYTFDGDLDEEEEILWIHLVLNPPSAAGADMAGLEQGCVDAFNSIPGQSTRKITAGIRLPIGLLTPGYQVVPISGVYLKGYKIIMPPLPPSQNGSKKLPKVVQ